MPPEPSALQEEDRARHAAVLAAVTDDEKPMVVRDPAMEQVIKLAGLKPGARLLDLGAGTGDLAREALAQEPRAKVVAADFTLEMMRVGRRQGNGGPPWSAADALKRIEPKPFPAQPK